MSNTPVIDFDFKPDSGKEQIETVGSAKFVLLYFLTFGLYSIWWMYNVWRFFKEKDDLDIMPVWRSLFAIFFIYRLFDNISDFAKEKNPALETYSSGLLTVAYIITTLISRAPDPWWMLSCLAGLCFIQPVNVLRQALDASDKYEAKDSGITIGQIVIFVIGGILWILLAIGLYLPEDTGNY